MVCVNGIVYRKGFVAGVDLGSNGSWVHWI